MICGTKNEVIIINNSWLSIFKTPSQTPIYQLEDTPESEYHHVFIPYDTSLGLACMHTPEAVRDWMVYNWEL